ncbi:hypothetical protein DAI22_03g241548 [Oryza sativa Japonica Group]|nr:hypothetical protein DAI22_03g241548 [Oryza sativa Japonica Group]
MHYASRRRGRGRRAHGGSATTARRGVTWLAGWDCGAWSNQANVL